MIFIGKPIEFDEDELRRQLDILEQEAVDEEGNIREEVKKIVPTYHPTEE